MMNQIIQIPSKLKVFIKVIPKDQWPILTKSLLSFSKLEIKKRFNCSSSSQVFIKTMNKWLYRILNNHTKKNCSKLSSFLKITLKNRLRKLPKQYNWFSQRLSKISNIQIKLMFLSTKSLLISISLILSSIVVRVWSNVSTSIS